MSDIDCDCGPGWIHMDEPYEIQKCDTCEKYKSDEEAVEAHRKECGCTWPEVDFQDACLSWLASHTVLQMPRISDSEITDLELLLDCRGVEFMDNVPEAIKLCAELVNKSEGKEREIFFGLLQVLKKVHYKIEHEELKLKDFGFPPDGKGPSVIKQTMTDEELLQAVEDRYNDDNQIILDEYVDQAAASLASSINNEGPRAQAKFLIEQWGTDSVTKMLLHDVFNCEDPDCPDKEKNPFHDHPKED